MTAKEFHDGLGLLITAVLVVITLFMGLVAIATMIVYNSRKRHEANLDVVGSQFVDPVTGKFDWTKGDLTEDQNARLGTPREERSVSPLPVDVQGLSIADVMAGVDESEGGVKEEQGPGEEDGGSMIAFPPPNYEELKAKMEAEKLKTIDPKKPKL